MSTPASATTRWTTALRHARLHVVTGKGGTGKTTVAAAMAMALASEGNRTLLVEVEARQGIAQLFDSAPLPYSEEKIAVAPGGGELYALAVDPEAALLEYLAMFYNLGFAGRTLRRMGAIEFATTLAPGLRDVLLTGKVKECVTRTESTGRHVYDAVVLDAPPTGRVVKFLDVTRAMSELAKVGPVRAQSDGVIKLLHSEQTAVHVVSMLEELPVREGLETLEELAQANLRPGAVLLNRVRPSRLPERSAGAAAQGSLQADRLSEGMAAGGLAPSAEVLEGLIAETTEHATRMEVQRRSRQTLAEATVAGAGMPVLELPELTDGVDVGALYELADLLRAQGVAR